MSTTKQEWRWVWAMRWPKEKVRVREKQWKCPSEKCGKWTTTHRGKKPKYCGQCKRPVK